MAKEATIQSEEVEAVQSPPPEEPKLTAEQEAAKKKEAAGKSLDAKKGDVVLPGVPIPGLDPEEKGKLGRREAFAIAAQNPISREMDEVRAQAVRDAEEAAEEAKAKGQQVVTPAAEPEVLPPEKQEPPPPPAQSLPTL